MYRPNPGELRLTQREMRRVGPVLDHTVIVEAPENWTHEFTVLHGDAAAIDLVCALLREVEELEQLCKSPSAP